jgi:hypothetical protein
VRRPQSRILRLLSDLDAALALQREIANLEDDEREPCPWCGALIDDDELRPEHLIGFSMKEYWGPLRFDESFPDRWRVALLVDDEWRWMGLMPPYRRDEPYRVEAAMCSERCVEAFTAAVKRVTAARRPH